MEIEPDGKSAQEIVELWTYIADRLEKNFRRTVFNAPGQHVPTPAARAAGGFGRKAAS
jgi:chromosome partitioning protein